MPAPQADIYQATCSQLASLEDFQEQAVDNLIADRQLGTGDYDVVLSWGRQDATAELWALVQEAFQTPAGQTMAGDPVITSDDVVNVDSWMSSVLQREAVLDAQDAALEYVRWAGLGVTGWDQLLASNPTESQLESFLSQPPIPYENGEGPDTPQAETSGEGYCVYSAPAPDQGQYTNNIYTNPGIKNMADASCYGGSGEPSLGSLPTPTLQNFQTWGEADLSEQVYGNTDFAAGASSSSLGAILIAIADTAGPAIGAGVATATAAAVVPASFALSVLPYAVPAAGVAGYVSGAGLYAAGLVGDEVLEALETAAIWEASTGIGAVVGAAIFAVTTAVQQGISVVGASQLPGQLASGITTASPGESLATLASTATGAQGLFTLLVGAEGPPPLSTSCANPSDSTTPAVSVPVDQAPCANDTPIPAPSAADAQWLITPSDGTASSESPTLTWQDQAAGLTSSGYLSGNWLVDTATPAGYPTSTTESDRFVYTDWQGNTHTAWVYDDSSTPGFVTVLNSSLTSGFDPGGCVDDGTCAATPTIEAVDGNGNDITVGVTSSTRDTSSPVGPPPPTQSSGLIYLDLSYSPTAAAGQAVVMTAEIGEITSNGDQHLVGAGGTVTFSDPTGTLCSDVPVITFIDSRATCGATFPTAGSVPVTATYSGSGSDSADGLGSVGPATADIGVTVVPDTVTMIRVSPTVGEAGAPVTYRADVALAGDDPGPAPGGTVTFYYETNGQDEPFILCEGVPLTAAAPYTASCTQTMQEPRSNNTIYAAYSGDDQTGPSLGQTGASTRQSSTTTTVTPAETDPVVGQPDLLTATVAVNPADIYANSPTGTVDFVVPGAGPGCTDVPLTATPPNPFLVSDAVYTATCSWTPVDTGGTYVTAAYGGDAYTSRSSSNIAEINVGPASTATSVTVAPSGAGDGRVLVSASVSALAPDTAAPVDGGGVRFFDGSQFICGSSVSSGTASCVGPSSGSFAGPELTGDYQGDHEFADSSGEATLNTTLTISPSTSTPTVGDPENVHRHSRPPRFRRVPPTGTVTFAGVGGACVRVLLSATSPYTASCDAPVSSAPTTTVGATYSGDATNDPSSGSLTLTVGLATTATSVTTSDSSPVVGEAVTYTATVDLPGATNGPAPTGSVSFTDGTTTLCDQATLTTSAPYTASCTTSWQATMSTSILVSYLGDANTEASSLEEPVSVSPASTSLQLTTTDGSPTFGQSGPVLTASIAPVAPSTAGPSPTGTVSFSVDGQPAGNPVQVSGAEAQSPPLAGMEPGSHTVTAQYSGDTNYTGSTDSLPEQVSCTVTITKPVKGPLSVNSSTCIDGTTVKGQISVAAGAALALSGATISGTIVANQPGGILICGSDTHQIVVAGSTGPVHIGTGGGTSCGADHVQGSVRVTDALGPVNIGDTSTTGIITLWGDVGGVSLFDSAIHVVSLVKDSDVNMTADTVTGNLQLVLNTGTTEISDNSVAGTVKLLSNSTGGGLVVEGNTIGTNLVCSLNSPSPTNPGPANTVSGRATGQCAKLG